MTELTATGRDFLVLWRWREALRIQGTVVTEAWGTHAGGLNRGDRMFVWATKDNELYLLGAIEVKRSGDDWNEGRSLYGPFQIIPLKGLKWKLRFQQTDSVKLSRKAPLARQVRARRRPTPETTIARTMLFGVGLKLGSKVPSARMCARLFLAIPPTRAKAPPM